MNRNSTTKIEKKALNALESIIDKQSLMDYDFNSMDKEMSWDGYIWLYKNGENNNSKEKAIARIPVQIKGHEYFDEKYLCKNQITYSVEIKDLDLYSTEKGVLYFEIFLHEEMATIFYATLYPSKILDYKELASSRGNKDTISVSFTKLENNPDSLFIIAKLFNDESIKQGSSFNPLVVDRIRSNEFEKLKEISFSVIDKVNIFDILKRLSVGDICLHGKTDDQEKYFRPLEWKPDTLFFSEKDVFKRISVNNIVFYDKYKCIINSNGKMTLLLSPNLIMKITDGEFKFSAKTNLDQLGKDAKFLLAINSSNAYSIENQEFKIKDKIISNNFENELKFISDVYDVTHSIGIDKLINLTTLSKEESQSIITLVDVYLGAYNHILTEPYTKYNWKFGNKYYPLLIIKKENYYEIVSSLYTKNYAILIPDENNKDIFYKLPIFAYHNPKILSNLFNFDFKEFEKQIQTSDYNLQTTETLNCCSLSLIEAYDIGKDERFLKLADAILTRIINIDNNVRIQFNKLQIKARLCKLDKNDFNYLNSIDSDDIDILFGKNVLLGNYDEAHKYFSLMTDSEKSLYKSYPIYTLFNNNKKF